MKSIHDGLNALRSTRI